MRPQRPQKPISYHAARNVEGMLSCFLQKGLVLRFLTRLIPIEQNDCF